MSMISDQIKNLTQKTLKNLGFGEVVVVLEHPSDEKNGDFASNIAMTMFAKLKITNYELRINKKQANTKNPRELADIIVNELKKDRELTKIVSKIEVAGPGFINFWFSPEYLISSMVRTIEPPSFDLPTYHLGNNKKILVEFAHPNTHKPFHIGHLRNISIGESLVRILESLGNTVIRGNYEGDVGMHIAKCLWALKKIKNYELKITNLEQKIELLGKAYVEGNNAYEDSEEFKKEIEKINKQIYSKDPAIISLWQETRQWSLDYFEMVYKRVYSHFDRLFFESEVYEKGLMNSKKALKKGILEISEGAVIFKGEKHGLDTRVFITKEGYPTYEGKELGLAELETSLFGSLDKIIHVVTPEQSSFFKVTFKVEELIDEMLYKGIQQHYGYGFVRLTEGKMSSRKGTVILGMWLLDEVKKKIIEQYKINDEIAEVIAVGAVKYSLLKVDPKNEIAFDIEQSISLEGNSGPYLQYTFARARSVVRKSKFKVQNAKLLTELPITPSATLRTGNFKLTDEETSVLRTLYKFPEVVLEAGKTYSPNLICNYLYDLAQKFNLFYQKIPILNSKDEEKQFRLALTQSTSIVLQKGLDLLGIKVLEKM